MSDVTLLRKLTRKSILKFGQYAEVPIQTLLDLKNHKYLRWIYFNSSNIDFMEDILDEIKIPNNSKALKPSFVLVMWFPSSLFSKTIVYVFFVAIL